VLFGLFAIVQVVSSALGVDNSGPSGYRGHKGKNYEDRGENYTGWRGNYDGKGRREKWGVFDQSTEQTDSLENLQPSLIALKRNFIVREGELCILFWFIAQWYWCRRSFRISDTSICRLFLLSCPNQTPPACKLKLQVVPPQETETASVRKMTFSSFISAYNLYFLVQWK